MGKWIHSDGKAHFGITGVRQTGGRTCEIPCACRQRRRCHLSGKTDLAMDILTGSFEEQSRRTVKCLTKLNAVVEAAKK